MVEEGTIKGKRVDYLIHGKMIGCCLSLFLRKSKTEMVVMTEGMEMAGMTGVIWIVPIFLILVMQ
jgi:hypothetical protein